jgi:heparosan-N-sulfate-glucuronate 5-epimerase
MIISSHIFYIMITGIFVISIFSIADNDFLLTSTVFAAETIPDDKGVIMVKYPSHQHSVYNPLILAGEGLNYYTNYNNTGDIKSKEYFINTANWLVNNAKHNEGGYSLWANEFTWPWYNELTPPYYSAYTQAMGIDVLARAYALTNNQTYLDEANKAFLALIVNYDYGGVTTIEDTNGDLLFFHELAKPGFQKTYILNGQTGALLHIWQFYEITHYPAAKAIFDKGINYLKYNLWKYDTGSWSRYDLTPIGNRDNLASMDYQKIHIDHLKKLYDITGEPILKEYSDKFNKYCNCV